jgi:predicted  nucleic acid-binding Zn-ribbon protein
VNVTTRDEYIEKFKAQLDEWNDDLEDLERTYHDASDETKQELEPQLEKIRETRDAALRKLDQIGESGEDSWESAKRETEHVWTTLKESVHHFKSRL